MKVVRRSKNFLVQMNRQWPFLKVGIFCTIILMAAMGATLGGVRSAQMRAELKNAEVGRAYDEVAKVMLGGEEVEVTGMERMEEEVNKKVEQAEEEKYAGKKLVALTFDDGPDEENTAKILGVLAEKKVKATFFMVGIMIQRTPETAKKVAEAGHEVETHSMRHANLTTLDLEGVKSDIAEAKGVLREATGAEAKILRPPYGAVNEVVKTGVEMPMVSWSVDPDDWRDRSANDVRWRVVNYSYDGAIILLHDIYETTAEAVGGIIDDLRGEGYEFVTVRKLAEMKGIKLNPGEIYRDFAS